jgi:hypothetical protein
VEYFVKEKQSRESIKEAIETLKTIRRKITLGKNLSIRKMREEGRK